MANNNFLYKNTSRTFNKIIYNVIGSFSGGMYTGRLGDLGDLVREVSYAKVFYLTSKFNI